MLRETFLRLRKVIVHSSYAAIAGSTTMALVCATFWGSSHVLMRYANAQEAQDKPTQKSKPTTAEKKAKEAQESTDKPKTDETAAPLKKLETIENSIGMELVLIPAGKFVMGSPKDEKGRKAGEFQRPVTIEKPFYMGIYEVTQEQYVQVIEENRSIDRGADLPVGNVSFAKAMEFCRKLSRLENQTYRLPTEAEWEYACRAGTTTPFHYGNSLTYKDANIHAGWPYGSDVSKLALKKAKPVGSYKPNAFGLYDMHGNVFEWCLDELRHRPDLHIVRGGGGDNRGVHCRSAYRWNHNVGWQWTGLRVVRTVEPEPGEFKIPLTHGLDKADRFTTADLIAKLDEALKKPAAALLPSVVIFPAVDAKRRVRDDGFGLSWVANYKAAYTPRRRMQICLPNVRHRLREAGCLKPGSVIDDESIRICLAAIGAKQYVLPQLTEENNRLTLTFAVHKIDEDGKSETSSHSLKKNQLTTIPGLIARGVLEHLGASLDKDEITHIAKPQIRKAKGMQRLSQFAQTSAFGKNNRDLLRFVLQNPRCLASWELYVFESHPAEKATKRFKNASRRLACDRLKICAGVRKTASHDGLLEMFELAPQFPGDTYYFSALAKIAKDMSEPELVEHVLKAWRKADSGYSGCKGRGDFLVVWAWKARGGGWASSVTKDGWKLFGERLARARKELEKAIEINPLGWEAHTKLITVGMAMSLPLEFVDEHFDEAIRLRPRYARAYSNMFQTLQPRWGGDRDELLSFAELCVQTNYWEEGIPDIGRRAIEEIGYSPGSRAHKRTTFRDSDVWDVVDIYAENARNNGTPKYQTFALNLHAKFGAYGGHFEEVAESFRTLEKEGPAPSVFWDGFTYGFLRDLVFANTETGQTQAVASLRAALDVGDFDKAEEWIAKVDADSDETRILLERSQHAIDIGRELLDERILELSAGQTHKLFNGINAHWKVEGDSLVCRAPAGTKTMILLPFGISRADISGTISWAERPERVQIFSHTRAMRDNVEIVYIPKLQKEQDVQLRRGKRFVNYDRFQGDEVTFHLILDGKEDRFQPLPNINWTAPVVEHAPSGFGFQVTAPKTNHTVVKLKNVRIKLLE